jgi:hypothetical protein
MRRKKVISREYKLVLRTENFSGDEAETRKKTEQFWKDLANTLPGKLKFGRKTGRVRSQREIRFFDTANASLDNHHYIFRERKDLASNEKEITLKFRHADRYVSQDRTMRASGKNIDTKFEEDIKAPFTVLYSFSTTKAVGDKAVYKKLKHIKKHYPGFTLAEDGDADEENLTQVNDLLVREIVIGGPAIKILDEPLTEAECALIIWYDTRSLSPDPVIIEFSFRYGNKKGRYSSALGRSAFDFFRHIQHHMKLWLGEANSTKTGFIYANK